MNEESLYSLFQEFGSIERVYIPNQTNKSMRFGFIIFETSDAAQAAVQSWSCKFIPLTRSTHIPSFLEAEKAVLQPCLKVIRKYIL